MIISLGTVFAVSFAVTLIDASKIVLIDNGYPVNQLFEKRLPHKNLNRDLSNPSNAPLVCATAGSDGTLVAHENCNQFYKCYNGDPVQLICPANLMYNLRSQTCDWANNVQCGDRVIPCDSDDGDTVNEGDESNEEEDSEEVNNNTNCDPSEAPAICSKEGSDGILVAHEFCNKFYKCDWGSPFPLICPPGLLYNSKKEQCDWPDNIICGERLIPEESSEGPGSENNGNTNCDPSEAPAICAKKDSDGVLVAHEYCNQFYKCSDSQPLAMHCPLGFLYNSKREQCEWAQNVKCDNRIIPDEEEKPGNYDPSQASEICANQNSNSILVAHEYCNQFYTCSNGIPVALECPPGLLFNPRRNICDWPVNVYCGQRVIPEEDDETIATNHNSKKGTDNSYAINAPIVCAKEDSGDILVAHQMCNQYYKCANGITVAFRCPSTLLFNIKEQLCDWPEKVECGNRVIPDEKDVETEENDKDEQNVHEGHSDPSKAPYICAKEGSESILIAHEQCNYYYICWNTQPFALKCPEGLLYNPAIGQCDWPSNVKCNKRTV